MTDSTDQASCFEVDQLEGSAPPAPPEVHAGPSLEEMPPKGEESEAPQEEAAPNAAELEPKPSPPAAREDCILQELQALRQEALRLGEEFHAKLQYDAHKEALIDRLHEELQEHKKGLLRRLVRPLLLDIIHLQDDADKLLAAYGDRELSVEDAEKLLQLLRDFYAGLGHLLYRQGVDSFGGEPQQFDPTRQQVLTTVKTDDPGQDRVVAASVRRGFEFEGEVIRREGVEVFVCRERRARGAASNQEGESEDE